jgi:ribonucleoside-diphosphate reductase alpha chain
MKNKYLEEVLERYGKNTTEIWTSVITHGGSVQHLDFLSDWERDVFKTAIEIDQRWVLELAGDRQQYVCQSQSLNLFFPAMVSKQELHNVHMLAWKKGLKSLYYVRSEAVRRADVVSEQKPREHLLDYDKESTCLACEG